MLSFKMTRVQHKNVVSVLLLPKMNGELKGMVDKKENYSFGLSTLHAWIRTFEYLLRISYRFDIKKCKLEAMRINVESDNARKKSNKSLKNKWDFL